MYSTRIPFESTARRRVERLHRHTLGRRSGTIGMHASAKDTKLNSRQDFVGLLKALVRGSAASPSALNQIRSIVKSERETERFGEPDRSGADVCGGDSRAERTVNHSAAVF